MPEASARLRLTPQMRLKASADFAEVKSKGRRLARGCLVANWMTRPAGAVSRVGVITSRKLGGAVVRTRARRLLRESFRINQHRLQKGVDLVLVARASIVGKQFSDVQADFLSAMRQAGLMQTSS